MKLIANVGTRANTTGFPAVVFLVADWSHPHSDPNRMT
jgi:hypothetical protein